MNSENKSISLGEVTIRSLLGLGAGTIGALVLAGVIFLSWEIIGDVLSPKESSTNTFGVDLGIQSVSPLFVYIIILAIFLGSLVSHLFYTIFLSRSHEVFNNYKFTLITQIFSSQMIVVCVTTPLYFIASSNFLELGVSAVGGMHIIFSAFITHFIIQSLIEKNSLLNVYSIFAGICLFVFFISFIASTLATLYFISLPLIFVCMPIGDALVKNSYYKLTQTYGSDFLDVHKKIGQDYGQQERDKIAKDI